MIESLGEAFILSDADQAIQDPETMKARFDELRDQREGAAILGDTFIVEEANAIMGALSRLKSSLLE